LSKGETIEKYGKDQVQKWRRSFDISPPTLNEKDKRHPKYNKKYKDVPPEQLPTGEVILA
jgi:2,3-bisphosphoglycerate-dependent phosphoglycerate mutase